MLFDRLALLVETMLYVECIFKTNIPHLLNACILMCVQESTNRSLSLL